MEGKGNRQEKKDVEVRSIYYVHVMCIPFECSDVHPSNCVQYTPSNPNGSKQGSENIHSTKSSRDTLVDGIIKMLRKCSASTCSMHVCMLVTLVVRRCRATKSTCRYTKTHSNTDSLSLSLLSPPLRTQD